MSGEDEVVPFVICPGFPTGAPLRKRPSKYGSCLGYDSNYMSL